MAFELPKLAYAYDALEPYIDARTMEIHHSKHHNTYVTNLNGIIEKTPELAGKSLEALLGDLNAVPEAVRTGVRNHGGGTHNHNLFWEFMAPNAGGAPKGELAKAIDASFTSFDTQFAGPGKLAARILASDEIVGIFADSGVDTTTARLDERLCLIPFEPGEGTGENELLSFKVS